MSTIGGGAKIELQVNSGIFVDKAELENILAFNDNPKIMVKRLMRQIVGDTALQHMSAGGRGQRPGIPIHIRQVVSKFVRKNSAEGVQALNQKEYTRELNLICARAREKAKKEAAKTVEDSSQKDSLS